MLRCERYLPCGTTTMLLSLEAVLRVAPRLVVYLKIQNERVFYSSGSDPQPVPEIVAKATMQTRLLLESPYISMYPTKRNLDGSIFIRWRAESWEAEVGQRYVSSARHEV
jgi:hypothetical protein